MKINKLSKAILLSIIGFLVIQLIFLFSPNYVMAANENFKLDGFEGSITGSVANMTQTTIGAAIGIVRIVGLGIALTIIVVIAMKYMMASAGDRADIKKHAVPFVVGAVVLFGASGILGIILNFANTIS